MTNLQNEEDAPEETRSEAGDSISSELQRLDQTNSPCPSGSDSPTERGIAKTKKQETRILKIIDETCKLGSNTLDLSGKGMRQFPSEILEMPQIENLYLESNELTSVPDELFDKLPNLKWLDLRRNYLVRLPSVYTGRHQSLRNLLLEGNNLRTLPLELGLIKTLNGLNITNNPLEFPPQSIVEKGTNEILKFLREMIQAKSSGKLFSAKKRRLKVERHQSLSAGHNAPLPGIENGKKETKSASMGHRVRTGLRRGATFNACSARVNPQQVLEEEPEEPSIGGDGLDDDSSSSDDDWDDDGDLKKYAYQRARERALSSEVAKRAESEQFAPINKSAELHRPISYSALKQTKSEKIKKAGASGTLQKKPHSAQSIMNWKVNPYPEPPPMEYVTDKAKEERQLAKTRELKEKTDAILQRRKDEELLKDWRYESKKLQQKKYFESLRKGTKDFLDPVTQAPYDIDKDYIKIPTNAERIKQDVKSAHEKMRRALSPASKQRIEEEKAQRILELEKRIKSHTQHMHERRKLPKGSPQDEMDAARKELEVNEIMKKNSTDKAQRILELEKRIKSHTQHMHERRKLPKGSPQDEMDAARKELEVAEALHRELMARRKELEYRFRAFVADVPTTFRRTRPQALKRNT